MTKDQNYRMEMIGQQIDRIDSLLAGLQIPLPAEFHIEQLKPVLEDISSEMKTLFTEITKENPWE